MRCPLSHEKRDLQALAENSCLTSLHICAKYSGSSMSDYNIDGYLYKSIESENIDAPVWANTVHMSIKEPFFTKSSFMWIP